MNEFYEMGVKLALSDIQQSFKMTSSQSNSSGLKPKQLKLPKPPKPKMPETLKATEQPNPAPPRPMPTKSPDTGPYGMRYGGRGIELRS